MLEMHSVHFWSMSVFCYFPCHDYLLFNRALFKFTVACLRFHLSKARGFFFSEKTALYLLEEDVGSPAHI